MKKISPVTSSIQPTSTATGSGNGISLPQGQVATQEADRRKREQDRRKKTQDDDDYDSPIPTRTSPAPTGPAPGTGSSQEVKPPRLQYGWSKLMVAQKKICSKTLDFLRNLEGPQRYVAALKGRTLARKHRGIILDTPSDAIPTKDGNGISAAEKMKKGMLVDGGEGAEISEEEIEEMEEKQPEPEGGFYANPELNKEKKNKAS